jgi:hypothetical protein
MMTRRTRKKKNSALMILLMRKKKTNTKRSDDQADRLLERLADRHGLHPKRDLPALVADTMTMMMSMIDLDDHLEEKSQVEVDPHQEGDHQGEDVDLLSHTLGTKRHLLLREVLRR